MDIETCPTCGVPLFVSQVATWESGGVISCPFLPGNRGIFYEADIIDQVFSWLEKILGISIEHIIIESIRRDARSFMEGILGAQISEALTLPGMEKGERLEKDDEAKRAEILEKQKQWNLQAITIGRIFGYGDVQLGEEWETGDRHPWRYQVIRNPYSVLSYTAEAIGTVEAFEKKDMWAEYERITDNTFRIAVYPGEHHAGLKERLKVMDYDFKPGDIHFERCEGCGIPRNFANFQWNLEEGMITDPSSRRRMAFIPQASVDAIILDLEEELGEEIPEAVIEAQRQTVKSNMADENWSKSGWTFKDMSGLLGLGNISDFKASQHDLRLRIENACIPQLMVGFAQAMAEMAYKVERSHREWTFCEDGDLSILITV